MAGGGDELKLLGMWASPFVLRVKLALSFKGLSYEYVEQDLRNKSDLLVSSNPVHKKVPVLIHNGKPVCESLVIVQYLDEVFSATGPSFLPVDPYERAMVRFWASFIDEKLFASWLKAGRGKTEEERAEGLKLTFAAVETLEGAFKECSKGKPFFGGDSVGYLDIALGTLVAWIHAAEVRHGLRLFGCFQEPASGEVGGALRQAGRGRGGHAERRPASRARQGQGDRGCSYWRKELNGRRFGLTITRMRIARRKILN